MQLLPPKLMDGVFSCYILHKGHRITLFVCHLVLGTENTVNLSALTPTENSFLLKDTRSMRAVPLNQYSEGVGHKNRTTSWKILKRFIERQLWRRQI